MNAMMLVGAGICFGQALAALAILALGPPDYPTSTLFSGIIGGTLGLMLAHLRA